MLKYKALLVDLDDTLTKSNLLYNKALRHTSDFLANKYSLDANLVYQLALEKYNLLSHNFPGVHTRHSRILLFRMALDEIPGVKYDIGLLPEVENLYWKYFLENIRLYKGVKDSLRKMRRAGVKIAIVSDGDLSLRIRKTRAAGLLDFVDEIVASEEVIFEKPFSAIFTLALSRLHVETHEAVMLGNNLKNDIRGAQLVGIKAGIFNPVKDANIVGQDGTIVPDFEIKEFP